MCTADTDYCIILFCLVLHVCDLFSVTACCSLVLLSSHILHRGAYMWRKMRYASDNLSLFIDYMFDFLYIFGTFYFLKIGVQNVMGRAAT